MVGYYRGLVALLGSPTDHAHRDRVCFRVGANTFVPDDVLLPKDDVLLAKRLRYGWFLDKSHTKSSREKCGSQSPKQPSVTLSLEELSHGRKPCIVRTGESVRRPFDGVSIVLCKRLRYSGYVHVIGMNCVAQR